MQCDVSSAFLLEIQLCGNINLLRITEFDLGWLTEGQSVSFEKPPNDEEPFLKCYE